MDVGVSFPGGRGNGSEVVLAGISWYCTIFMISGDRKVAIVKPANYQSLLLKDG